MTKETITIKSEKKKVLCFMHSVQYSMKLTCLSWVMESPAEGPRSPQ